MSDALVIDDRLHSTIQVVRAFVTGNVVQPDALPVLIRDVHATLTQLAEPAAAKPEPRKPAVSIGRSVQPDFIVCLEDGKKLKTLKRYLRARFGLTPDQYRARWGLAFDYPMVAPGYAALRSDFAKQNGLGRLGRGARTARA